MDIVIALLLTIHGIIHLLGFLKAFHIAEIEELREPISKSSGIIWLFTFLVFLFTAILFLIEIRLWLGTGFLGILLSQALILMTWKDAKFGSIPNFFLGILILLYL